MRYLVKDITMTKNGYYRVWIGLRLRLMGEYNKMYNFTISWGIDAYNVKSKIKVAFEKLENEGKDDGNNNMISKNNCVFVTRRII